MPALRLAVLAALVAAPSTAQVAPPAGILLEREPVIPVHVEPHADGTAGVWAAGPDYKCSFHDGFVFLPRPLATESAATPFRWTLIAVTVDGRALVDAAGPAELTHDSDRVELRRDQVTEAYEVRAEGVEQTFVFKSSPGGGDLVIEGSVTTELSADARRPAHGALVFHDARGEPVVRYGEAWVLDAAGRRAPIATGFDGARISLTVPGEWLAGATYPVTVDPLTSRVVLNRMSTFFDRYWNACVARDTVTGQLMIAYGQSFGTTDFDTVVYITDGSFGNPRLVFAETGTQFSTNPGNVVFVSATRKWVLAASRTDSSFVNSVLVYLHDSGNTTPNSGTVLSIAPAAGQNLQFPDVGGTDGGAPADDDACVVYQVSSGSPQAKDVFGRLVDTRTATIGPQFALSGTPAGTTRRERPRINQVGDGASGSWVAVWQERDPGVATDAYDVFGARITGAGVRAGTAQLVPSSSSPPHQMYPYVAGQGGRFAVAFVRQNDPASSAAGLELGVHRFSWSNTSATPVAVRTRTVYSGAGTSIRPGSIAFDTRTRSHWAITNTATPGFNQSTMVVTRVGSTGGVVEQHAFVAQSTAGAFGSSFDASGITFDAAGRTFPFVHTFQEAFLTGLTAAAIYAQKLTYPADAVNVLYGTGCGGTLTAPEPPYAGHEFYRVDLSGATPNAFAVLEISLAPLNLPLAVIGMPGCFQLVDPAAGAWIVGISSTTSAAGAMSVRIPVQDFPPFNADLYFLYAFIAPGANALGVLGTRGLRAQFR